MQLSFSNIIHSDLKSQKYNQTLGTNVESSVVAQWLWGQMTICLAVCLGHYMDFISFSTESRLCLISLSLPMSSHFQKHHKSDTQYFAQL